MGCMAGRFDPTNGDMYIVVTWGRGRRGSTSFPQARAVRNWLAPA